MKQIKRANDVNKNYDQNVWVCIEKQEGVHLKK